MEEKAVITLMVVFRTLTLTSDLQGNISTIESVFRK